MKILLDAMGGDNAPAEMVRGAVQAAETYDADIVLIGDEERIRTAATELQLDLNKKNLQIVHAPSAVDMEDSALSVVREKSDSSMALGLHMLSEGQGDAFVSAGNTGALHAGSSLIVRRIRGIRRSAIASVLPFEKPVLLVDSGANIEVDPSHLHQFAMIGSIYMNKIFGIERPQVGLLNNGTEPTKGGKILQEAYALLSGDESVNFVGNVEGKQLPFGACDVLVTDGFTGNILLKTTEGVASFLMSKMKGLFKQNLITKVSALPILSGVKKLKKDFDASEYGGAPLLGLTKPVIKAHGSSDARAVVNAVRQAISFVETGVIVEIVRQLKAQSEREQAAQTVQEAGTAGQA